VELAVALVVAYLLGSIPTSYIVVYLTAGVNVRSVGDGNPGTMNVWENVGFWSGFLVALGDIGKGAAAVGVAYAMGFGDIEAVAAAFAAVIGHDFSIFLRLRGGNGTAAAVGGMLALVPLAVLPIIAIAIAVYQVSTRKRMIGAVGLLMVPVVAYWLGYEQAKVLGVALLLFGVALKIIRYEGLTPARSRMSRPR
jgi:glycerol-3-phosphate acyltransferase PlsY